MGQVGAARELGCRPDVLLQKEEPLENAEQATAVGVSVSPIRGRTERKADWGSLALVQFRST